MKTNFIAEKNLFRDQKTPLQGMGVNGKTPITNYTGNLNLKIFQKPLHS